MHYYLNYFSGTIFATIAILATIFVLYKGMRIEVLALNICSYLVLTNRPSWAILAVFSTFAVFSIPPIRRAVITGILFKYIRRHNLLPKISDTEQEALDAGDTWLEAELFSGKPDIEKILNSAQSSLSEEEATFVANEVNQVCEMTNDWEVFESKDLSVETWKYLKENKFFGMNIAKEYGGLGFSAYAQSVVVQKLATRSQVLGITVMVPNSLGPGELIAKYGTDNQKSHYLPRLANGRDIPCFGLTEPLAGSDAGSVSSEGFVFRDEKTGDLKVSISFEKRYITLGGIATVIGIAFRLKDPDNLLPAGIKTGITCALVSGNADGITRGRRHNPLGVPFINSPIRGKMVTIAIGDGIIGGIKGIGHGWKMLMECLAVGRGISLPAISCGGAKYASKVSYMYSHVRSQFGMPLQRFEAIEEVLAEMLSQVYTIDSLCTFTVSAVDSGHKPSVANAIAKYHATELFRKNVNRGMDILGGAGICLGPKNLIAHGYMGAPIAITVEGANIITRALMQFGQGLIRCHPYIHNEVLAVRNNNLKSFDNNFWKHIGHILRNRTRMILFSLTKGYVYKPFAKGDVLNFYSRKLVWMSASFAFLSDLALVVHGSTLKRKEKISGRFGDILSGMYIISAILNRFKQSGMKKEDIPLVKLSCESVLENMDTSFQSLYRNLVDRKTIVGRIMHYCGFFASHSRMATGLSDENIGELHAHLRARPTNIDQILSHVFVSQKHGDKLSDLACAYLNSQAINSLKSKIHSHDTNPEDAMTMGVINQEEYSLISEWQQLANSLIQVDDFPLEKANATI